MTDKKIDIVFPEINFDTNEIIIEAERRIKRKNNMDQIKYIAILVVLSIVMIFFLVYYQYYFIIFQVLLMGIISPLVLLYNFYKKIKGKEHNHGY
jgi:asparagine N-glycosylation enzyme membrane subunit Stt3